MSDEHTSAYLKTVATTLSGEECNSIINKQHSEYWINVDGIEHPTGTAAADSNKIFGIGSTNDPANTTDGNYNECEQVDLTLITTGKTLLTTSTMVPVARTTISLSTPFQTPSIAVTASTDVNASAITTTMTTKRTGKRSTKHDFVRFDSVETIFKHTDHEDIVERANIKDEIRQ